MSLKHQFSRTDWIALGALFALTLVLFARYLVPPFPMILPNSTLGTDLNREIWTLSSYLRDTFAETGQLALWRPYFMSGIPLFGNLLNPSTYPLHWIMGIQAIPLPLGLNLDMVLNVLMGGAGMYAVLRFLSGLRVESAFLGAFLFAHAPRLIIHMTGGHWWLVSSVIWIPWTYFFFQACWTTRRPTFAVWLGVALAFCAMNNLQYAFYNVLMLLAITVITLISQRQQRVPALKTVFLMGSIAALVAFGLIAAIFLPQLSYLPITNRAGLTYQEAVGSSLPLVLLAGIFVPTSLRFPESFLYLGVGTVLLIIVGLAHGWGSRERRWGFGTLIAMLLSIGANGVLYSILYHVIPGFSLFRTPQRFYIYVLFGAAALAAFGFEAWLKRDHAPRKWLRPALFALSIVYLVVLAVDIAMPNLLPFEAFPTALIAPIIAVIVFIKPKQVALIALISLIALDLLFVNASLSTPITEETLIAADDPVITFLRENTGTDERVFNPYALVSDMSLLANGLYTADGYNGAQIMWYSAYLNDAIGCDYEGYSVGAPSIRASAAAVQACPQLDLDIQALNRLNVRYVILPEPHDQGELVFSDETRYVYDLGEGYGRGWGVFDHREAACNDGLEFDDSPNALVSMRLAVYGMSNMLPQPVETLPTVLEHGRTLNGEWFVVNVVGTEAVFVRSEAFAPGLHVYIDDYPKPISVFRAYCALQGVWVPSGTHRVEIVYLPYELPLATIITWVTTIIVIGLVGIYPLARRFRLLKKRDNDQKG